ncbi:MAG: transporter substrate-binding domain-containing protein [Methanomicrobiales archaeon]|nr:transporter substrate-binding domain-containing protein [Methanomicrobiales archaeon]
MSIKSLLILIICIIFLVFSGSTVLADDTQDTFKSLKFVTEEFPPFNYVENGTASGLMVDMITSISRKAGYELPRNSITFLPWSDAYQTALKEPGTVIFSIAKTPEREELFSWLGPVISSDIALYSSRSRNITIDSLDELANYTLGAVSDDVAIDYLARAGIQKDAIITGQNPYTLFRYLDDGTIDLFAYGDIAAEYHIRNATGKSGFYKIVKRIGTFSVFIGFNKKTSPDVVNSFRAAFEELNKTPDYGEMSEAEKILSSWLPEKYLKNLEYLTEGYYPYTILENGIPRGISVDILKDIFSRLHIDVPDDHFTFGTWEDVYQTALTENNTMLCILARSPEREDLFRWAGPVDKTSNVIFCPRDKVDQLKNLSPAEMKIGAVTDDIATTALLNAGGKDIVYEKDPQKLINMLEKHEIDGWAYASMPGKQLIQKYAADPDSIVPVHHLATYDYYYAFNLNTPAPIVQAFQDMFDIIRTDKDQTGVSMYDYILYRYIEPVNSESTITAEEVEELVNQTAADLAHDAPGTIKNINAGLPPYRNAERPDLYVFAYDSDVTMIAHADNIRMVGTNYHNKTDVAGKPFRDMMVEGALINDSGWEDYIYSNPVESGLFWKTTRYQLALGSDGKKYVVCSGMFRYNPE